MVLGLSQQHPFTQSIPSAIALAARSPDSTKFSITGVIMRTPAIATAKKKKETTNPVSPSSGPVFVAPQILQPHPHNVAIYGEDEDVSDLVRLIQDSDWIKPLVVTPAHTIISGHRRWKAAQQLKLETIPVEYRSFPHELAELEALLLENASRHKTTEQKVREANLWKTLETELALQRQKSQLKQGNTVPVQDNCPEREKGQTRDHLAARVGLGSGKTYERAARVTRQIDEWLDAGQQDAASALRKVLNYQSVAAAYQLLKMDSQQRDTILSLIASAKAKTVKGALQLMKRAESIASMKPPNLAGFSKGDIVEVNEEATNYVGLRGRVDQLNPVEQQIWVELEQDKKKVSFQPCELTLIAKMPPPVPYQVGDWVRIEMERNEAIALEDSLWNGFWGEVVSIGETGSVEVNVGAKTLRILPRDLQAIDLDFGQKKADSRDDNAN